MLVRDKFCLISNIYRFIFFSVSFLFFSLQRWQWAEGEIFLSKCCCLLALFLYGSIVLTILTPTLFFMWMSWLIQLPLTSRHSCTADIPLYTFGRWIFNGCHLCVYLIIYMYIYTYIYLSRHYVVRVMRTHMTRTFQ